MKILILSWILLFSFNGVSQNKSNYFRKGAEQFEKEEYDAALKSFSKEFKKNKSTEVRFMIASCYFKKKDFSEAKIRFLEIIRGETGRTERVFSLVNLGSCYRSLKQLDSALYYYDQAILLDDQNDDVYFNKAQLLYYEYGDFQVARSCYDSAIKCNPNNWYYYQKRLEVNFASAHFQEALVDLKKVERMHPETHNEMNFAYCYSMLEMYDLADSVFMTVYDDSNAYFLNNYGFNKFKLGDPVLAVELIRKSLIIYPENPYAYRNLALIEIAEDKTVTACEYLRKAKELDFKLHYGDEVQELIEKYCSGNTDE